VTDPKDGVEALDGRQPGDSATRPDDAGYRRPSVGDLLQATQLLGCPSAAAPRGSLAERPVDRLARAAMVLAAAEAQVANAEEEVMQTGGTVADAWIADEITARIGTGGDPWACRRWLAWHAGRLIYQLRTAEARGDLPPKAGTTAAHSVCAAHRLLLELTSDHDGDADLGRVPRAAIAQAREDMFGALREFAELAYGDGHRSTGDRPPAEPPES
jgi:hypothetical protein